MMAKQGLRRAHLPQGADKLLILLELTDVFVALLSFYQWIS